MDNDKFIKVIETLDGSARVLALTSYEAGVMAERMAIVDLLYAELVSGENIASTLWAIITAIQERNNRS